MSTGSVKALETPSAESLVALERAWARSVRVIYSVASAMWSVASLMASAVSWEVYSEVVRMVEVAYWAAVVMVVSSEAFSVGEVVVTRSKVVEVEVACWAAAMANCWVFCSSFSLLCFLCSSWSVCLDINLLSASSTYFLLHHHLLFVSGLKNRSDRWNGI